MVEDTPTPNAPSVGATKSDSLQRAILKLWQAEIAYIKAYDQSDGNINDHQVKRVANDIDAARQMAARLREARTSRNLPIE